MYLDWPILRGHVSATVGHWSFSDLPVDGSEPTEAPVLQPGAVIRVGDERTFVVIAVNKRPLGYTYTLLFDHDGDYRTFEEFVTEIDCFERDGWIVNRDGVSGIGRDGLQAS